MPRLCCRRERSIRRLSCSARASGRGCAAIRRGGDAGGAQVSAAICRTISRSISRSPARSRLPSTTIWASFQGADRRRMAALQERARRVEPVGRGLSAGRRHFLSGYPVSFCLSPSAMTGARRPPATASSFMSGRCDQNHGACPYPRWRGGDGTEIRFNYEPSGRLGGIPPLYRLSREIIAQAPMDPYRGAEIQPGNDATSDEAIDAFIRDHAESAYHPCGTVRMGRADDPLAVVDPQCRVIGVDAAGRVPRFSRASPTAT